MLCQQLARSSSVVRRMYWRTPYWSRPDAAKIAMNAPNANAYEYSPVEAGPRSREMKVKSTRLEKSAANRQTDSQKAFLRTIINPTPTYARAVARPFTAFADGNGQHGNGRKPRQPRSNLLRIREVRLGERRRPDTHCRSSKPGRSCWRPWSCPGGHRRISGACGLHAGHSHACACARRRALTSESSCPMGGACRLEERIRPDVTL